MTTPTIPTAAPLVFRPSDQLRITRVGTDQLVTIDGQRGVFTPLATADPADPASQANLEKVVDALRQENAALQSRAAELSAKIAELETPARSADDFASGLQHTLDGLQDKLADMQNATSDFAVREFALESKVHVDVTDLGTIGLRFVQPGEEVNAGALSTVSVTIVPVPKPAPDPAAPPPVVDAGIESIDGLTPPQLAALRGAHVQTVAAFQRVATRSTASAALVSLLGVDRAALGRYTLLAGLLTVPGLDRVKAAVLYDAGIRDVATLAASAPAELVKAYAAAAKQRTDDDGFRPSEADAAAWSTAAAALAP